MLWIDAAPHTTQMIDLQAVRDRANVVLIRPSMGRLLIAVDAELAISPGIDRAKPKPTTRIWFGADLALKPL